MNFMHKNTKNFKNLKCRPEDVIQRSRTPHMLAYAQENRGCSLLLSMPCSYYPQVFPMETGEAREILMGNHGGQANEGMLWEKKKACLPWK